MNCKECITGVYEPIGFLHLNISGNVNYEPTIYAERNRKAIEVQICSLCGNVNLQGKNNILGELKREIRTATY